MKKLTLKLIRVLMSIVLLVAVLPVAGTAATVFSDIEPGIWYEKDVYALVSQGVLSGTGNGKFSPGKGLTRAEIAAMLANTVLTESDVNQYKGYSNFTDVPKNVWFTPYINWAYEAGIISGYGGGIYRPYNNVNRQELAQMIVNFSTYMAYPMKNVNNPITFTDNANIENWARASVEKCQRAGVISGFTNGSFQPKSSALRSEAASMYNRFLSSSTNTEYTIVRKKVNGISVRAVEFTPTNYTASAVIGLNSTNIYNGETMQAMVSRTGAKFAINAAYFDLSSYFANATIINNGKIMTVDNNYAPYKPAFVVDTRGNASIQGFTLIQTATVQKADGTQYTLESSVVSNKRPSTSADATRILFDRSWGTSVGIYARDAIAVDSNGYIVQKVSYVENVNIPEGGFVLYQRARRTYEGEFFDTCSVGDKIIMFQKYPGSEVEDISMSIASGPRIVKNSAVYGNASTYRQEGLGASDIASGTAKRVAIGVKGDGKVVMLYAYCTVAQLSDIMVKMGCKDAMNLDGGASTGIYANGLWLVSPDRKLNNIIAFS